MTNNDIHSSNNKHDNNNNDNDNNKHIVMRSTSCD